MEPLSGEFDQFHHSRLLIGLFLAACGTSSFKKALNASMTGSSRASDVWYCKPPHQILKRPLPFPLYIAANSKGGTTVSVRNSEHNPKT